MDFFIGLVRSQRSKESIGRCRLFFCVESGPGLA